MATRSGSVDPGLLLWVKHGGLDAAATEHAWSTNPACSGFPAARRTCAAARGSGRRARALGLAIEVYLHRLRASVAAMAAAMGGIDALAFTGGVGEAPPPYGRAPAGAGVPRPAST